MKKDKPNYTIGQAILIAEKAGYKIDPKKTLVETISDPQCWLYLGMAIGWDKRMACPVHGEVRKAVNNKFFCSGDDFRCTMIKFVDYWKFQQHQYVSWLQMGGNTYDFFAELE